MAGRPKLQKLARDIEASGLERDYESGEDWVLDLIADGKVMREVCAILSEDFGYRVTRPQLQAWIKLHPDRRPKVDAAREYSAWAHAEESGQILEDLYEQSKRTLLTGPDVSLAKERSHWKRWYASKLNPALGDRSSVEVQVSASDSFLAALVESSKKAKALSAAPAEEEEEEDIVEAEVLAIEAPEEDVLADLR